jgi:hypothetical protein
MCQSNRDQESDCEQDAGEHFHAIPGRLLNMPPSRSVGADPT